MAKVRLGREAKKMTYGWVERRRSVWCLVLDVQQPRNPKSKKKEEEKKRRDECACVQVLKLNKELTITRSPCTSEAMDPRCRVPPCLPNLSSADWKRSSASSMWPWLSSTFASCTSSRAPCSSSSSSKPSSCAMVSASLLLSPLASMQAHLQRWRCVFALQSVLFLAWQASNGSFGGGFQRLSKNGWCAGANRCIATIEHVPLYVSRELYARESVCVKRENTAIDRIVASSTNRTQQNTTEHNRTQR